MLAILVRGLEIRLEIAFPFHINKDLFVWTCFASWPGLWRANFPKSSERFEKQGRRPACPSARFRSQRPPFARLRSRLAVGEIFPKYHDGFDQHYFHSGHQLVILCLFLL